MTVQGVNPYEVISSNFSENLSVTLANLYIQFQYKQKKTFLKILENSWHASVETIPGTNIATLLRYMF